MYRELLEKLTAGNQWANVQEPCPEEEIQRAEEYVGFTFPEELKALLRETNGDHWFLLSGEELSSHVKGNREIFPEYLDPDEFYRIGLFHYRGKIIVSGNIYFYICDPYCLYPDTLIPFTHIQR